MTVFQEYTWLKIHILKWPNTIVVNLILQAKQISHQNIFLDVWPAIQLSAQSNYMTDVGEVEDLYEITLNIITWIFSP